MPNNPNPMEEELKKLLSLNFLNCNPCLYNKNLAQFNATINFLISANIPFSLQFQSGTRDQARAIVVNINVNPSTSIVKIFQLEEGTIQGI